MDAGRRCREDREGEVVSALEELAQAVLDGRVTLEQTTSRTGTVRTKIVVAPRPDAPQ